MLEPLGSEVKRMMLDISTYYDFTILEMEVDKDHIHLLVEYEPKVSLLSVVRRLKQVTTYRLWQEHEEMLSHHFWKEKTFWSDEYFVSSIGNVSKEAVERYIQEQG